MVDRSNSTDVYEAEDSEAKRIKRAFFSTRIHNDGSDDRVVADEVFLDEHGVAHDTAEEADVADDVIDYEQNTTANIWEDYMQETFEDSGPRQEVWVADGPGDNDGYWDNGAACRFDRDAPSDDGGFSAFLKDDLGLSGNDNQFGLGTDLLTDPNASFASLSGQSLGDTTFGSNLFGDQAATNTSLTGQTFSSQPIQFGTASGTPITSPLDLGQSFSSAATSDPAAAVSLDNKGPAANAPLFDVDTLQPPAAKAPSPDEIAPVAAAPAAAFG